MSQDFLLHLRQSVTEVVSCGSLQMEQGLADIISYYWETSEQDKFGKQHLLTIDHRVICSEREGTYYSF